MQLGEAALDLLGDEEVGQPGEALVAGGRCLPAGGELEQNRFNDGEDIASSRGSPSAPIASNRQW